MNLSQNYKRIYIHHKNYGKINDRIVKENAHNLEMGYILTPKYHRKADNTRFIVCSKSVNYRKMSKGIKDKSQR